MRNFQNLKKLTLRKALPIALFKEETYLKIKAAYLKIKLVIALAIDFFISNLAG